MSGGSRSHAPALPVFQVPRGRATPLQEVARSDAAALARDVQRAAASPTIRALLDVADSGLLVLNERREIVAYNDAAAHAAGREDVRGVRPGEALACTNAQTPDGCGTAPACATCGALGAIETARTAERVAEAECLLRSAAGGALEFSVRATPLAVEGAPFVVLSLRDVSAEKRRDALEQVFLHDVLNTVGGLRGWATLLRSGRCDVTQASERIDFLSRQVEREICDHRDLFLAERGALVPTPQRVACAEILRDVEAVLSSHAVARERTLASEVSPSDLALDVDRALLLRVVVNMARNALEATPAGGTVRLRATREPGGAGGYAVRFGVNNAGVMDAEVRHRVFVRSFTTKGGRGRGLGTYGMKLIGERYLGGEVSFTSTAEAGTTFWIRLPVRGRGT